MKYEQLTQQHKDLLHHNFWEGLVARLSDGEAAFLGPLVEPTRNGFYKLTVLGNRLNDQYQSGGLPEGWLAEEMEATRREREEACPHCGHVPSISETA